MSESTQTKQAIKQALIESCKTKPFQKISVQEIAKKAGINRQTFYYHFTDKYNLLRWVYREHAFQFLNAGELSLENWEEQVLKMLKAISEQKEFYSNTVSSDQEILSTDFSVVTQNLFIKLFDEIDEEKQLSTKDKYFYARFFSYGCGGVLVNWILNDYEESPMDMAVQLFRLAKDVEFFSYRLYEKEE
ncbi:MAG: TetR/AcrR family transcriptional regulator [Enterococcus sp.]